MSVYFVKYKNLMVTFISTHIIFLIMKFREFTLDPFQEDSVHAIDKNNSVIVSAPTGSGKTLIADYIIDKNIDKKVIYTAPIKALSNQKYINFCEEYGEDKIGLITGDIVKNPEANILIMTTEVYRNMAIIKDKILDKVTYCIMDEIHFINDEERGHVWEESIIFSPDSVRFLFLSATIPNAEEFAGWVQKIKNHTVDVITYHHRPVPLLTMFYDSDMGITTIKNILEKKKLDDIPEMKNIYHKRQPFKKRKAKIPEFNFLVADLKKADKLPAIYFVFSRKKVQEYATKLSKGAGFVTTEEKRKILKIANEEFGKLNQQVLSLPTTRLVKQAIVKGVAFHHAGLLPDMKHIVEKLFSEGLIKILFATETFAVGINMPARTVCFDALRKFTGVGFRYLNSKEYFQISGRAGRRGIDKEGLSVSMINRNRDDLKLIAKITKEDVDPIRSQFKLSYNTVLNLVDLHTNEEIETILKMNFYTYQELKGHIDDAILLSSIKARYESARKKLEKMGYIEGDDLTPLGKFTTKIFSDELEMSQIFSMDYSLDEHAIIMLLGCLAFEERKDTRFFKKFPSSEMDELRSFLRTHPYLKKEKRFDNMVKISAVITPLIKGQKFIDMLKNTNMLEGDLIRFLMQILDRLEQVDRAAEPTLRSKIRNCKDILRIALSGIHIY